MVTSTKRIVSEGGRSWFLVLDSFRSLLFPGGANVESSLFIGT
jgi:hypothetical protein